MGMLDVQGFEPDEVVEYLHTVLDATLASNNHYIILGRRGLFDDEVLAFDITGYPVEDIMQILSETLYEVDDSST